MGIKKVDPLTTILGVGSNVVCRVISDDVSVHWYPANAVAGTRCLCGTVTKREEDSNATDHATVADVSNVSNVDNGTNPQVTGL